MRNYEDYMGNQPMSDGKEIRNFFDDDEPITASQAKEFWRDVMGTIWHDPERKYTSGIMSTEMIAEYMRMDVETCERYLCRCKRDDLHLTERQGGSWVV